MFSGTLLITDAEPAYRYAIWSAGEDEDEYKEILANFCLHNEDTGCLWNHEYQNNEESIERLEKLNYTVVAKNVRYRLVSYTPAFPR